MKLTLLSALLVLPLQAAVDEPAPLKKSNVAGLWEGALTVGGVELRLAFTIAEKDGALSAALDSIDQGAKNIAVEKATYAGGKLTLELTKLKASFEGAISEDGKKIKGEWKQSGLAIPLELNRVDKISEARRPQNPKKPFPYDEEEVVIENKTAQVKLAGTLTKPKGAGPFRAVILITGSGPQDRDETILGHKPFWVLADHLTRKGIAVLRCDDRGTGKSTGDFTKATTANFASDVRAQVAFLKDRRDIREIGLIGHSEGGIVAPMVAADLPEISFIVLLAGTGVPGDELLLSQGQALLKAMKAGDETLKWQRRTQERLFKLVRDRAEPKELKAAVDEIAKEIPEEVRKSAGGQLTAQLKSSERLLGSPWLRWFLQHDPRPVLRKVRCPVLALNGALDTQVPAAENLAEIEKALKEGGNKKVTSRELPGLNHLFQTCKTGLPDEYNKIEETFAPAVLDLISDWIEKLRDQ